MMKIYKFFEKFLYKLIDFLWKIFIIIHEYLSILKKRKIYKNIKLSKEEKKQIDDFYLENYGKKVKYYWHRLYQSYTGNFDYKYIPEYLYTVKIEPKTNKRIEALPYENKNMLSVIFKDSSVKIPKTYIMCIKGRFFDENRNPIKKENAIRYLKNLNEGTYDAVVKATIDTNSGKDVKIISLEKCVDKMTGKSIEDIIENAGNNFVVQEKIIPHKELSKIYEHSINTFRVITYLIDEDIKIAPIVMRIGKGGANIDNAHAGGIFIGVSDEGKLLKEAYTEYQSRYLEHPDTKIIFEGYQIPCFEKLKKSAVELHKKVPIFDFVSWDFTIDKFENIVLIESNLHSQSVWISQIAHGKSFFGENTEKILKKYCKRRK